MIFHDDEETTSLTAQRLRELAKPKYVSLIRAIGNLQEGIRFLVEMRADILVGEFIFMLLIHGYISFFLHYYHDHILFVKMTGMTKPKRCLFSDIQ